MTTAAARLVSLAGATGTAGALLLMIGAGATAGAALVDYSGLSTDTAAAHLLADVAPAPTHVLGIRRPRPAERPRENDEALLLLGLL